MRRTLFTAVSRDTSRRCPGLSLLALLAPLLIAATPIQARPLTGAVRPEPVIAKALPNDDRSELACWFVLCIGAGGILAASRRRRRVTTA